MTTIERLALSDLDGLFEFRKKTFPESPRQLDRERWAWLYLNNPASQGRIPVWVLKADGRIVGSIASTDTLMRVDNRSILASFGNDFFVEKAYLGLLSLRLLKTMLSEYDLNVAANLSESARKLFDKMKYIDLSSSLDILTLPLLSATRLRSRVKGVGLSLLRKALLSGSYECHISYQVPQSLDDLYEQTIARGRVSIVKDKKYFKWRYESCPSAEFQFVSAGEYGRLEGVAVISVIKKQGVIMDILVPSQDKRLLAFLLQSCLRHFRENNCTECYTHVSRGWMTSCFKMFGFYQGISDIGLMYHTGVKEEPVAQILNDSCSWDFNLGDTDRI